MSVSPRQPNIWVLVTSLVTLTGAIVLRTYGNYDDFGTSLWWHWLALIAAFIVVETAVVRVHLRSETTAFSLFEVPLFLGAVFVPPAVVWASMVIGVAVVVLVIRRAPLVKAAFNIANFSLQGAVGLWVFHTLLQSSDPFGPRGWIAASVGAVASTALAAGAMFIVLLMVHDRPDMRSLYRALFTSLLVAFANVCLALIAASLIDYEPLALLLLALPTAVVYGAYRAYVAELAQRVQVEAMHELALEVRSIRDHTNVAPVLQLVADHLGARRAELVLFPTPKGAGRAVRFAADESRWEAGALVSTELVAAELAAALDQAHALATPVVSEASRLPATIAGAIHGEGRALGVLTVSGRLREGSTFSEADQALFSTIIEQLGLTFERHQLDVALSKLEERERKLEHEAHHDPLTGLANRALLSRQLDLALSSNGRPSLLFVDLDDFKHVNDRYGHDAGDEVLRQLAARFEVAVGDSDCVARVGGDEFAVLLDSSTDDVEVARALLAAAAEPIDLTDATVQVNASIGVARAAMNSDAPTLIKRADAAMYDAKGSGKGSLALAKARARPGLVDRR